MAKVLKFPVRASRFGFKRVPKRARREEDPAQLPLFAPATAEILSLTPGLSAFEEALVLDERGDPRAAELYQKAIVEEDCLADAYCNLGILESQRGEIAKAFDCFTSSLKHDPRHFEAHYNLGNLYFEVNDFRLAQVHYEIALEIAPSPNVYFNLALVLSINQRLEAAIDALTRYQELVPAEEGHKADDLLKSLKESLAASNGSQASTT